MSILNVRLIDANELRRNMYHKAFETDTDMQKWDSGCWIRYKMFEQVLESAPTIIDVGTDKLQKALLDDKTKRWVVYGDDGEKVEYRRVENGEWLPDTEDDVFNCSNCDGIMVRNVYKYCPWCGSEMREQ